MDGDGETSSGELSSTGEDSETTAQPGSCGDGLKDAGEACDDGDVVEDACPSGPVGPCQAATTCGDGSARIATRDDRNLLRAP
jgi:hypothetical protein